MQSRCWKPGISNAVSFNPHVRPKESEKGRLSFIVAWCKYTLWKGVIFADTTAVSPELSYIVKFLPGGWSRRFVSFTRVFFTNNSMGFDDSLEVVPSWFVFRCEPVLARSSRGMIVNWFSNADNRPFVASFFSQRFPQTNIKINDRNDGFTDGKISRTR